MNSLRIRFILQALTAQGKADIRNLSVLDVGCGGGLACEPLARLGANVLGVDTSPEAIECARAHAKASNLEIDYRNVAITEIISKQERFDVVLALEVVEHVDDPAEFISQCNALLRDGGLLVLSTLNRSLRSYMGAIVAAEHIFRWVPPGTHQWNMFITPSEISAHLRSCGLEPTLLSGMIYNPITKTWKLGSDVAINYIVAASNAGTPLPQ